MSVVFIRILFLLFLTLVSYVAEPNDKNISTPKDNNRPKIGLALSGGGARGAAHVGVLKQLEQQDIPIDYITGTSMGALIGGLYASGLTPNEIEKIILEMDWSDVLSDAAAREDRSFRRKRDDDLYVVKPKARIKEGKFGLPSGIVVGQKIDFLLKTLTINTTHIESFSDLTIPFKAIATDIVTGEEVILDSGDLTMALRASMSIPAVFTPVEIDGQFLVDGGVANNLPINVVRDMGADIIIAVDISSPLRKREELSNVLNITDQLTGFLTKRNSQAQIAQLNETDILITPELNDISMMDFDKAASAVEIGYLSSTDSFESLRQMNLENANNARRTVKKLDTKSLVINQVVLDNRSTISDDLILTNLTSKAGELIDLSAIENDIETLYGWQLFENVRYTLEDADDKKNLVITVEEKQIGLTYLQFGMKLFDDFSGVNDFDLSVAYTNPYLNDLRGEFRAGVQIGNEPVIAAELYQPIDSRAKYFINPAISYTKQRVSLFEGDRITAEYAVESISPALSFGLNIRNWGELRTGLRYTDGSARIRVGDPDQENLEFENTSLFFAFTYDALNSIHFPTDGNFINSEFRRTNEGFKLSSNESFNQFEFIGVNAHSWLNNTVILKAELGTTFNDNAPIQSLFSLGGFTQLSGFRENQLGGQHKGLISGTYLRSISENSLFPIYLGASLEYGNVWQFEDDISFSDAFAAGSVFIGVDSIVGPLYLAYGQAEGGTGTVYLYLGDLF